MTSTIRVTSVGPAPTGTTTNLMNGLAKALLSYDQRNATTDSSFNISSVADETTGITNITLTTNTSSATDRIVLCSCWNTDDDGSTEAGGDVRGFVTTCQHHSNNTTSRYDIETAYGSYNGIGAGDHVDTDGQRSAIYGDLA